MDIIETINLEKINQLELEEIITFYDQKFFKHLQRKEYVTCEKYLEDFCYELLELSDEEQTFVARTFFVSIITDIIRVNNRKNLLHPRILSFSYSIIAQIEQWNNLSEFLLSIPWFIDCLKDEIIAHHVLFDGNIYVEKALKLIQCYLSDNKLSVNWIARQLQISTTHLSNLFKLQIGENISSYISKRKLNEIIYEMKYTNQSLEEIRKKYGFMNHSNFIQHFKKHQGMTPLQYRQTYID
ncbi:AraC family transcriptional regulator [Pseudogracilibacillus sp. SE30717A]|uniref:helix-turn-helix domain-containing protein n=1 Tax=Pseudogracilibacillus sp. SE30717A TaxID=3098293 RepID=UPI00300DD43B